MHQVWAVHKQYPTRYRKLLCEVPQRRCFLLICSFSTGFSPGSLRSKGSSRKPGTKCTGHSSLGIFKKRSVHVRTADLNELTKYLTLPIFDPDVETTPSALWYWKVNRARPRGGGRGVGGVGGFASSGLTVPKSGRLKPLPNPGDDGLQLPSCPSVLYCGRTGFFSGGRAIGANYWGRQSAVMIREFMGCCTCVQERDVAV
ncbi:hypothetical protein BDK51DRAFT_28333 [Blyttiomyces helicus]|uniref:Uncharacterized protein n=1 Tax=Blyttiomyces helicus TaxID=388810 RepID=A0A4P9WAM1_9FUNG|nr:hypothetical protein BDK51DRAFT_28333 [Blyttiomyces helicus]|eukprot:RKO89494.1 hypothetical protein BDK51DRAFT_28333 [Blyttiomyces helicus]